MYPLIVLYPTHMPWGLSDVRLGHSFIVYYSDEIITKHWMSYLLIGCMFLSSHQWGGRKQKQGSNENYGKLRNVMKLSFNFVEKETLPSLTIQWIRIGLKQTVHCMLKECKCPVFMGKLSPLETDVSGSRENVYGSQVVNRKGILKISRTPITREIFKL